MAVEEKPISEASSTKSNNKPTPRFRTGKLGSDNWADYLPSTDIDHMFKGVDWSATPLGPLSSWSISLRLHTFTLFADSRPSAIYWGPQMIVLFNEAFLDINQGHTRKFMGASLRSGYPTAYSASESLFKSAAESGRSSAISNIEWHLERLGQLEECYFDGTVTPLRGDGGEVEGFYNMVWETTRTIINERRRLMFNQLEVGQDTDSHIIPVLEQNPRDIPMALLYRADEETVPGTVILTLRGRIGVPDDHPLALESFDLSCSTGLAPLLREARWKAVTVPVDSRFDGVQWRGFGEPSKFISIIPILGAAQFFGFAVIGANLRRPLNEDHDQFIRDLSSNLSAISARVFNATETRKREGRLRRELAESTRQIRYMAEHASIGMHYISTQGRTIWANEKYYRLTGHPRVEDKKLQYPLSFIDTYIPEDQPKALDIWNRLIQGECNIACELHLKQLYNPPLGEPQPSCVLTHSFLATEDDQTKYIMTFTTDISAFKWAEASEARKAAEAREDKRKQEEFIDLVSHEMRNPLSAMFQLSDTIINSCPPRQNDGRHAPKSELVEALQSNIEAASTILLCAQHQKRIVDDILTLSKLQYTILSITPRPTQLPAFIKRTIQMFEQELISHDINIKTVSHPSLEQYNIKGILCDESRVQQILINLLTNAIKFTKTETKREIEVSFGAILSEPRSQFPDDMFWAPKGHTAKNDLTLDPEWGAGQQLYLTVTLCDTGAGMSQEQIRKLFARFEQASLRTSIRYGGSGLGLFISQKLAERQGGEIGVRSVPGKGSTFAFYIKSRRTEKDTGLLVENSRPQIPSHGITTNGCPKPSPGLCMNLDRIHVLLVEDNLVNQKVVQRQLLKAGCVVFVANHGAEALELLRQTDAWYQNSLEARKPDDISRKYLDIILMDWEMPVMDGLTCSREIRRLETAGKLVRHVDIIGTTANARPEQIETALQSGIDSVMVKPFIVNDLIQRMRERLAIAGSPQQIKLPQSNPDT